MKHLVFIINPRSGVDRNKQIKEIIESHLDMSVFSYEIQYTQRAKHGEELAQKAAHNNAFAVIAVGGDGSVNDVIRGLVGTNTALGIIPKGSGNGLARTLKIPLETEKAIQTINRCLTEKIDIAFANEMLFSSNAGVGFDALVCHQFATSEKRGILVYAWLITKNLWTYRDLTWELEVDGQKYQEKAFFINIANGKQFGYNFKIAEDASWTDGLLDVVIVSKFPKILGALLGLRMLRGTLLKSKYVKRLRGKNITISNPSLVLMQTDGDPLPCTSKITFTIKEREQTVIVGAFDEPKN